MGIGKLSKLTAAASVPAERERERDGSYPNLSFIPRPYPLTKRNSLVKQSSETTFKMQTTGSKKVRIYTRMEATNLNVVREVLRNNW